MQTESSEGGVGVGGCCRVLSLGQGLSQSWEPQDGVGATRKACSSSVRCEVSSHQVVWSCLLCLSEHPGNGREERPNTAPLHTGAWEGEGEGGRWRRNARKC